MDDDRNRQPPSLTGEQARQGRIVLSTPARQVVFVSAFVLIALFGIVALVASLA